MQIGTDEHPTTYVQATLSTDDSAATCPSSQATGKPLRVDFFTLFEDDGNLCESEGKFPPAMIQQQKSFFIPVGTE